MAKQKSASSVEDANYEAAPPPPPAPKGKETKPKENHQQPPPPAPVATEESPAAVSNEDVEDEDDLLGSEPNHRQRLLDFYERYNPEKLGEIDTILAKFKGREDTLFKKLKEKYPSAEI